MQFLAERHARERFDVMYNDFVIVGPSADPAKVAGQKTAAAAFSAIAAAPVAVREPRRQVGNAHRRTRAVAAGGRDAGRGLVPFARSGHG